MENLDTDTIISSFAIKIEAPDAITTEEVHIVSTLPAEIENVSSRSTAVQKPRKIASFKCYMCAEKPIFDVKASLEEHLSTVHSKFEPYSCEECNITSYTAEKNNYHLSRHDASERPHKCSACPMRFVQEAFKKRHEANMHMISNGYFVSSDKKCCLICGKIFATEQSMQEHMTMLHQKNTIMNLFWCYLCSTVSRFDDNDSLVEHMAATHPEQESYKCTECNITLHGRTAFNWHLSTHDASVKPYKCTFCSRRFKSQASKHKHEHVHSSGRENGPECQSTELLPLENCRNELPDYTSLSIKTEPKSTEELLPLENCRNELPDYTSLSIKTEPQSTELLPLENCRNELPHYASLSIKTEPQSTEELLPLENCRNELPDYASLSIKTEPQSCTAIKTEEVHIYDELPPEELSLDGSVVQTDFLPPAEETKKPIVNIKSICCYLCSPVTQFKDSVSLYEHLSKHSSLESYKCQDCNKSFDNVLGYNVHRSRHDANTRLHKCDVCSLRFIARKHLTVHESTVHNIDNRKYACLNCGKRFSHQHLLKKHECTSRREIRNNSDYDGTIEIKSNLSSTLSRKRSKATPVPKEVLKCYLCRNSPQFEDKAALNVHILSVHVDQDTYECNECNTTIQDAVSFNLHLVRHDADLRPAKCSICSLRFRFRKHLSRHESTQHNINKEREES